MNKLCFFLALATLVVQYGAAQSVFEGTWKIDFSKAGFPEKPVEYLLQNGMYTCKNCLELSFTIKADGQDQPIPGNRLFDTQAVKVVNDHQIHETEKKDGKIVGESTETVSADGNTLSVDFYWAPEGASAPVKGNVEQKRVAKGPPGSHAISGSWQTKKMGASDVLTTYKVSGDELKMTDSLGMSYTAKMDGTEAPLKGNSALATSIRVKLIAADTLEETDLRDGKVLSVSRMTVGPDGKKAKIVTEDKQQNTTSSVEAVKQ